MKKIKVLMLQTWFDISIQETGNVYNASAIAFANGRSVSDTPAAGELVTIPEGLTISAKEIQYFKANNIVPATGIVLMPRVGENYELPNEFPISL